MIHSMAWCVAHLPHAENGVERHLPYVVCVENKECGPCYSHKAWCSYQLSYAVLMED